MKFVCLLIILARASGAFAQPGSATLKVTVSGYEGRQGEVMLALYNTKDSFLEKPVRMMRQKASAGSIELVINELEPGGYGIAVYLDENNNQKLNKNIVGIPKEPYGFSNGVRAKLAPPSFDATKIQVSDGENVTAIELK